MKRIMFVCTGNTCRSPMAEAVFLQMLKNEGLDGIAVSSAGIAAADGFPASENAVLACSALGLDISGHRSKRLTRELFLQQDVLFTMTKQQSELLCSMLPHLCGKVFTICGSDIADPYGGGYEVYAAALKQIQLALESLMPEVRKWASE